MFIKKVKKFNWCGTDKKISKFIKKIDKFVVEKSNNIHDRAKVLKIMHYKLLGEKETLLGDVEIVENYIWLLKDIKDIKYNEKN